MKIFLYDGSKTETLDIAEIARYLEEKTNGCKIEVRGNLIAEATKEMADSSLIKLAEEIAKCKIQGLRIYDSNSQPLPAEVEYEKRRIQDLEKRSFGILYDGFKLLVLYRQLLQEEERNRDSLVIIFTDQLFGTWDRNNCRYHARVSIYGSPAIISTTGIVEAPARPREFYLEKQYGIDMITRKEKFKEKFIDYEDPRLTEVMKGYCMQALFYHISGEPFCEDNRCRLYNAHWQEEVIKAQLTTPEFCERHEKIISDLRNKK